MYKHIYIYMYTYIYIYIYIYIHIYISIWYIYISIYPYIYISYTCVCLYHTYDTYEHMCCCITHMIHMPVSKCVSGSTGCITHITPWHENMCMSCESGYYKCTMRFAIICADVYVTATYICTHVNNVYDTATHVRMCIMCMIQA